MGNALSRPTSRQAVFDERRRSSDAPPQRHVPHRQSSLVVESHRASDRHEELSESSIRLTPGSNSHSRTGHRKESTYLRPNIEPGSRTDNTNAVTEESITMRQQAGTLVRPSRVLFLKRSSTSWPPFPHRDLYRIFDVPLRLDVISRDWYKQSFRDEVQRHLKHSSEPLKPILTVKDEPQPHKRGRYFVTQDSSKTSVALWKAGHFQQEPWLIALKYNRQSREDVTFKADYWGAEIWGYEKKDGYLYSWVQNHRPYQLIEPKRGHRMYSMWRVDMKTGNKIMIAVYIPASLQKKGRGILVVDDRYVTATEAAVTCCCWVEKREYAQEIANGHPTSWYERARKYPC